MKPIGLIIIAGLLALGGGIMFKGFLSPTGHTFIDRNTSSDYATCDLRSLTQVNWADFSYFEIYTYQEKGIVVMVSRRV